MSIGYIKKTYGVPAKRGGRIRFQKNKTGVITGTDGQYLRVRFDGEKNIKTLHPVWEVEYLCHDCGGAGEGAAHPSKFSKDDPFGDLCVCWACGGTGIETVEMYARRRNANGNRPATDGEYSRQLLVNKLINSIPVVCRG